MNASPHMPLAPRISATEIEAAANSANSTSPCHGLRKTLRERVVSSPAFALCSTLGNRPQRVTEGSERCMRASRVAADAGARVAVL
jgi:hypothetical protein